MKEGQMGVKINIADVEMKPHPKFDGVKIGFVVTKDVCCEASITILEIPGETELPIHTHEKEADTIFVLQGEGEIFINGKWEPIKAGDIVTILPKEEHGLKVKGEVPMRCYIIHAPALW
jgi:quercetin dioxygenase-like cupin family protein